MIVSEKISTSWLKVPIARLWDYNLFTVNAKADALARDHFAYPGNIDARLRCNRTNIGVPHGRC